MGGPAGKWRCGRADRRANGDAARAVRESVARCRGIRSARCGTRTSGRGPASACVRWRMAAEPTWRARATSRAAFAFRRDSVSVCPYLNVFYSEICN
jgi:hypothetical protein